MIRQKAEMDKGAANARNEIRSNIYETVEEQNELENDAETVSTIAA